MSPFPPADDAAAPPVRIAHAGVSAEIIGGELLTVRSLRRGDEELLVDPATLGPSYRVHARRAGITLLHPWANRLGEDDFRFDGHAATLAPAGDRISRDDHGLAIHGLLAPEPWRPQLETTAVASAELTWPAEPAFPFSHRITVRFTLADTPSGGVRLSVETSITALAQDAVPISFGWHPYFRCPRPAVIELPGLSWLSADDRGLPTGQVTPRPGEDIELSTQSLDDGVADLPAGARMRLHRARDVISMGVPRGYAYGQIFAPRDAPVVSFEPMTAPTDALRRDPGIATASPGQPFVAHFTVDVEERPPS